MLKKGERPLDISITKIFVCVFDIQQFQLWFIELISVEFIINILFKTYWSS
jgi:hypothetical protein